jgi:predicted signal transduction protein with EAL and GGDEF domain
MSYLAQYDFLTGLPNRMLLNDRLNQAIALAHRHHSSLALLFADVDDFKGVNDSLGHTIGDQLLQSITPRLVACVRDSDTVCRLGGTKKNADVALSHAKAKGGNTHQIFERDMLRAVGDLWLQPASRM